MGDGSSAVLADAQFGTAKVVKPFPNFASVYQGVSGDRPIAFPGVLSPDAGKPGVSPNLLAGIPCAFGSKLVLWVPSITTPSGVGYRYQVVWRLRNLRDFRESRANYHFPKQSAGFGGQFVVPAAHKVLIVEGQPISNGSGSVSQIASTSLVSSESLQFSPRDVGQALTPSNQTADYQQGVAAFTNDKVTFSSVQMDAEGDEFLILAYKVVTSPTQDPNWDFSSDLEDKRFNNLYGNGDGQVYPDLGIYVMGGSNP